MQIISTNIAKPVTIEWQGKPLQTGIYKYGVAGPLFLGAEDVGNDHVLDRRYHGGPDKACYLFSADNYPYWQSKYPDKDWKWGMFGENLTVTGLDESEIRIGDCYQIGDALVQVSQPRQPCFKLGVRFGDQNVVNDFWNSPYPGVYVRVLKSGKVIKGDELLQIDHDTNSLSVSQIFSIFTGNRNNFEMIQKAIQEPFLAESCRNDIRKLLK